MNNEFHQPSTIPGHADPTDDAFDRSQLTFLRIEYFPHKPRHDLPSHDTCFSDILSVHFKNPAGADAQHRGIAEKPLLVLCSEDDGIPAIDTPVQQLIELLVQFRYQPQKPLKQTTRESCLQSDSRRSKRPQPYPKSSRPRRSSILSPAKSRRALNVHCLLWIAWCCCRSHHPQ